MNIFTPPLRPPGAVNEEAFLRLCVHCGKCIEVCPHGSLKITGGFGRGRNTPRVDPAEQPCQLCMKCPPVCPTGALARDSTSMENAGMGTAYILTNQCHNYIDSTMCMTCYDRCPLRGSAVILVNGLTPAITNACVGCGVCAYVCPLKAIEIVPRSSSRVPEFAADIERKP